MASDLTPTCLFDLIMEILYREVPAIEPEWAEDAAREIRDFVIETYGPPF